MSWFALNDPSSDFNERFSFFTLPTVLFSLTVSRVHNHTLSSNVIWFWYHLPVYIWVLWVYLEQLSQIFFVIFLLYCFVLFCIVSFVFFFLSFIIIALCVCYVYVFFLGAQLFYRIFIQEENILILYLTLTFFAVNSVNCFHIFLVLIIAL